MNFTDLKKTIDAICAAELSVFGYGEEITGAIQDAAHILIDYSRYRNEENIKRGDLTHYVLNGLNSMPEYISQCVFQNQLKALEEAVASYKDPKYIKVNENDGTYSHLQFFRVLEALLEDALCLIHCAYTVFQSLNPEK